MEDFIKSLDWQTILLILIAIFEVIVRLTPSEKDNSILNKIIWVVEKLVPNKTKGKKPFLTFKKK